ncbi:gamma-glutamylcyclotransferase [bacterium]|nr:gamma-glutamylcyclotransferase [candidate division CSSED10-310 bacterium]
MSTRMFAYGSNLCLPRLCSRIGSVQYVCIGRLIGYRFRWHKAGDDGSGKGDAFYTGVSSDCTWGAVFECRSEAMAELDIIEGVGSGYDRVDVPVETKRGVLGASAYLAIPATIEPNALPYDWYQTLVLLGALSMDFPAKYVAELASTPCIADPDRSRWLMHMNVVGSAIRPDVFLHSGNPMEHPFATDRCDMTGTDECR